MKIATITCHDVYNYGASLQAYALQHYLKSLGHDVEIIDYKPAYQKVRYNFWYVPPYHRFYRLTQKSRLFHLLYCLRLCPITFKTWHRIRPFKNFKADNLKLTTRRFASLEELQQTPPIADAYIAGSDQIWNYKLPNGKDGAFFLDFGNKDVRRLSYAASIAQPNIASEYRDKFKKWLAEFDAVSVREKSTVALIEDLGLTAVSVLDPVFLLNSEQWRDLVGRNRLRMRKYILVYNLFPENHALKEAVNHLSKANGWDIVAINDARTFQGADENVSNAGPSEFVNLICNAEYVIADSFHATAFSVIFHRPFSIYYCNSNISRMQDFLDSIGLSECLNPAFPVETFEWEAVEHCLICEIGKSKSFLKSNLS